MNFIKKIIFFSLFIFLSNISVSYTANIIYVDIDYILNNSKPGKSLLKNLKDVNDKNMTLLTKKEKKIKTKENELNKKKNIISKEDFNKELTLLRNEINEFRSEKSKMAKNFNENKQKQLKLFFEKINPILEEYMKKNNINMIVEKKNVFLGDPKFNLTKEIIKIIDQKVK
tara:strand:- start:122 stop:634 length:513 start_codon:yes stop_codon:yes gene_type:complete